MTTYYDELCRAMYLLSLDERAIFVGQAVFYPGTGMTNSFARVPREQIVELPVFEETQLGISVGLALAGLRPVSVYPRWNFLIAATNQLVNHLDKFPIFAGVTPRVVVRVASANPEPLHPGAQHLGDFSNAFRLMFSTIKIVNLLDARRIVREYEDAAERDGSTILVEYPALYEQTVEDESVVRSPDRVLPVG